MELITKEKNNGNKQKRNSLSLGEAEKSSKRKGR
jgi:hypothetical protein